jgi:hypothetical protein
VSSASGFSGGVVNGIFRIVDGFAAVVTDIGTADTSQSDADILIASKAFFYILNQLFFQWVIPSSKNLDTVSSG